MELWNRYTCVRDRHREREGGGKKEALQHGPIEKHCFKVSLLDTLWTFVSPNEFDEIVRFYAINEIQ